MALLASLPLLAFTTLAGLSASFSSSIAMISSTAALEKFISAGAYNAMKAAVIQYAGALAQDVGAKGIRVNAISPSGTTRMSATAKVGGKTIDLPFIDPNQNGVFVAFLCSDHANWVSGQIFGTGGERVVILEHPNYGTGMYNQGGWGVDDLVEHFEQHMKKELEPLGIMKRPYPFYDGVNPPAQ